MVLVDGEGEPAHGLRAGLVAEVAHDGPAAFDRARARGRCRSRSGRGRRRTPGRRGRPAPRATGCTPPSRPAGAGTARRGHADRRAARRRTRPAGPGRRRSPRAIVAATTPTPTRAAGRHTRVGTRLPRSGSFHESAGCGCHDGREHEADGVLEQPGAGDRVVERDEDRPVPEVGAVAEAPELAERAHLQEAGQPRRTAPQASPATTTVAASVSCREHPAVGRHLLVRRPRPTPSASTTRATGHHPAPAAAGPGGRPPPTGG